MTDKFGGISMDEINDVASDFDDESANSETKNSEEVVDSVFFCPSCGAEITEPGAVFCAACGAPLTEAWTVDPGPEPEPDPVDIPDGPGPQPPLFNLKADRSLVKILLLSIVTLAIYGLVCFGNIADEVNTVCSKHDGKKSMNYWLLIFIVSPITCGIASLVWMHNICNRIGNELTRRGIDYSFGAKDFWLWCVLGMLILVGPIIFLSKFIKSVNLMNADYNQYG